MKIAVVIMAGGMGTRLYPASTQERPKQFIPWPPFNSSEVFEDSPSTPVSLLQSAYHRLVPLAGEDRIFVATTPDLAASVRRDLPQMPERNQIIEPMRRNSAGACAFATAFVAKRLGPDTVVILAPADAVVLDDASYQSTLFTAASTADDTGAIVVIGMQPDRPATEYGYIRPAAAGLRQDSSDLSGGTASAALQGNNSDDAATVSEDVSRVMQFLEKPTDEVAQTLLHEGCLWNAGIFVWRADAVSAVFQRFLPVHGELFECSLSPLELDDIFGRMPSISIDVGIAERADHVYCVNGRFRWDDLGSWDAFSRVLPADPRGNVKLGSAHFEQSSDCIAVTDCGSVISFGVSDLVIVRFGSTVLVCPRDRSQEVGRLAQALEAAVET